MFRINVEEANKKIKAELSKLSKKNTAVAISRAINRSIIHASLQSKKLIKQEYKVTNTDLNFKNQRSSPNTLTGNVGISHKAISLSRFNPRYEYMSGGSVQSFRLKSTKKGFISSNKTVRKRNAAKGVSIEIAKGERKSIGYSFLIPGKNAVFARGAYKGSGGSYDFINRTKRINKSGSDTPIDSLVSTSAFGMFKSKQVYSKIEPDITVFYEKRILSEVQNLLK